MHHSHNPLEVGQNASRMWLKNICPFIGLIKKKKNPLVFASFLFCDFIVIQEVCFSIGTSISSKTIPLSSNFEPVHWSDSDCCMSGSTCHFLTCIQISQEAGKVFWDPHLFMNFPQFVVIHCLLDENGRWKWFHSVLHSDPPLFPFCVKPFLFSIFFFHCPAAQVIKQSSQVSWRIQDWEVI